MPETREGIPLVPKPSRARLDERQQMDYREHRRDLIDWLLVFGKDPLFETLDKLRDAALSALDNLEPPQLSTYLCL
jgi:hypothetical protein